MTANTYHFITRWYAPGATIEEVYSVLSDVEALPIWWPAVYRTVTETKIDRPIAADGTGRAFDLLTKGWLPYTLHWKLTVLAVTPLLGSTIGATGDFEGRGIWTFQQVPAGVDITFDWKLDAEKPLLKILSPILKPAFAANHAWAMRMGLVSLLRELDRRRNSQAPVPPPPPPTTWQPYAVMAASVLVVGALVGLLSRRRH